MKRDKYMRLKAGEVIPFGILNDNELSVNVVFDNDLFEIIGIHLLRNDKTLFMKTNELIRMIKEHGNSFKVYILNNMYVLFFLFNNI